jgi:hypothetical protein
MAINGLNRLRLGAKRISFPDFVRASAEIAIAEASGSTSDSNTVADADSGSTDGTGSISTSISISISQGIPAKSEANAPIPTIATAHDSTSGQATSDADIPSINTVHDASSGESEYTGSVSISRAVVDALESDSDVAGSVGDSITVAGAGSAETTTRIDIPIISTVHNMKESKAEGTGSVSITTWKAGLGGVVKDPSGNPVNGAEVHIIRDNDDTKVATTVTSTIDGSDGRWHVTLPGGKTTDPDPEVYSIEVWYRDGPKRDPDSTVFNAKNRPFIDTADPSETDPYTNDYYYG